jgi:hypothetical protein
MITGGHFLDGREFRGTMRSVDAFPTDDVLSFRDGKIRSRYLLLHGFPETPYESFLEKEASEADRLIFDMRIRSVDASEELVISAIIEKDEIDVRMQIEREFEAPEYLHFSGKSEDVRVGYRSLAG